MGSPLNDSFPTYDKPLGEREDNRDGDNNNNSWNCGAGRTDRRPGSGKGFADGSVEFHGNIWSFPKAANAQRKELNSPAHSFGNNIPISGQWLTGSTGIGTDAKSLFDFTKRVYSATASTSGLSAPKIFRFRRIRGWNQDICGSVRVAPR